MANPLSRGHSLLADYLDASGVVPLPISEVHMNAPVPTREQQQKKQQQKKKQQKKKEAKCMAASRGKKNKMHSFLLLLWGLAGPL